MGSQSCARTGQALHKLPRLALLPQHECPHKLRAGVNAEARTKCGGTRRSRANARDKGKVKETPVEAKGKEKEKINAEGVGADVNAGAGSGNKPSKRRRVTPER